MDEPIYLTEYKTKHLLRLIRHDIHVQSSDTMPNNFRFEYMKHFPYLLAFISVLYAFQQEIRLFILLSSHFYYFPSICIPLSQDKKKDLYTVFSYHILLL